MRNRLFTAPSTFDNSSAAEPLYQRALAVREKALGPDHPDVTTSLNNLALLYKSQGRYEAAEPLYKRALAINEKALGLDHPNVATSLNNLAELYRAQGRYEAAEPLYQRALAVSGRRRSGRTIPMSPRASTTSPCCTKTRAATTLRSRSTSGRWRSQRRRSGRSIPTLPLLWRTTRLCSAGLTATTRQWSWRPAPKRSAPSMPRRTNRPKPGRPIHLPPYVPERTINPG